MLKVQGSSSDSRLAYLKSPMHIHQQTSPGFVLRPSVTLCIPWGGLCCVWFIWVTCTASFSDVGGRQLLTLMSGKEFLLGSVANAALMIFLAIDFWISRRSPPGLKRGHQAGIVLAVIGIALAQVAFLIARQTIESQ
jgi:hypothetical protein